MKNRMNLIGGVLLSLSCGILMSACTTVQSASNRPNILFITSDDINSSDVREYVRHFSGQKRGGGACETPSLDKLCKESLCFEDAYAAGSLIGTSGGMLSGRAFMAPDTAASSVEASRVVPLSSLLPAYDCAFIGRWDSSVPREETGFGKPVMMNGKECVSPEEIAACAVGYLNMRTRRRDKPFFLCLKYSAETAGFAGSQRTGSNPEKRRAASIRALDGSVGKVLQKLWRYGLDDNTVVMFMPLGAECGGVAQVPLMIRWKGYVKAGTWSSIRVDSADILPTIMQCAGYFPESFMEDLEMEGCSLTGLFRDAGNKSRSYERDIGLNVLTGACFSGRDG